MTSSETLSSAYQIPYAMTQRPYAPSWVNRMTAWIDRLPGPYLLVYTILAFFFLALTNLLNWRDGGYAPGTFVPLQIVVVASPFYYLALIHYLDRLALDELAKFRPVLDVPDDEVADLAYRLVMLPPRNLGWATAIGLLYAAVMLFAMRAGWTLVELPIFTSPLAIILELPLAIFAAIIHIVFTYHAIHQLRMVYFIYARHARVDLFNRQPLYALSNLSAQTAVGGTFLSYAWFTTQTSSDRITLVTIAFMAALGVVVFLLPLQGIHRKIEQEKARVIAATGKRLHASTADAHRRLDEGQYEQAVPVLNAIGELREELAFLETIPTWPWPPGTLRNVVSAIILPLLLWLLTKLLEQIVMA